MRCIEKSVDIVEKNKRHRVKLSCFKPSCAVRLSEYAFLLFDPTEIGSL